ncbi:unnamed protein product [Agarophyton chilense]
MLPPPSRLSLPSVVLWLAWRSYLRKLQVDPLLTKSITAAVLSVLSEVAAKRLNNLPLKSSTAIHELTIGLVLRGPLVHAFHNFLDNVLFKGANQTSAPVVAAKLLLDQFVFAPMFTSLYFYVRGLSEDRSLSCTTKRLRKDLFQIMKSNWALWLPANLVNYLFVPLQLRVLFASLVALFWNAHLISKASTAQ